LTNGVKFDSSRDGKPLSFKLGVGQVIKGWDEGIAKLRVGDHAILVIPSNLAYGAKGAGDVIPPDANLIFVVEIVDVKE
jgi:peptidylprolyl isomerase